MTLLNENNILMFLASSFEQLMSLAAEEAPSNDHKNSLEGKFGKQKLGQKLQKVEYHKKAEIQTYAKQNV